MSEPSPIPTRYQRRAIRDKHCKDKHPRATSRALPNRFLTINLAGGLCGAAPCSHHNGCPLAPPQQPTNATVARIFSVLAAISTLCLVTNLVLGLRTGDMEAATRRVFESAQEYYAKTNSHIATEAQKKSAQEQLDQAQAEFAPMLSRLTLHIWVGIVTALLTLLVNAVAITYFIGTARWCREVVETFDLDRNLAFESLQRKRRVFVLGFLSMLVILAIVFCGALADPTRSLQPDTTALAKWRFAHFTVAVLGSAWIILAYGIQIRHIAANSSVIATIMDRVELASERDREAGLREEPNR